MIQVNLLPVRSKKKKENVRQLISIYLLCVVLALCVMGFLWSSQRSQLQALERRNSQLQQEVAQYAKYDALLKDLTKKKETIDKKIEIIRDLQRDRDTIPRMLALISVELPSDKMWFEKFSLSANGVTLEGVALSNEAIAEFMRNLDSSPYIEKGSVNLTHSRQVLMRDMKLREFQVTYRFFPFSKTQEKPKPQPS